MIELVLIILKYQSTFLSISDNYTNCNIHFTYKYYNCFSVSFPITSISISPFILFLRPNNSYFVLKSQVRCDLIKYNNTYFHFCHRRANRSRDLGGVRVFVCDALVSMVAVTVDNCSQGSSEANWKSGIYVKPYNIVI